jgi:hypothetical protein
MPLLMSPVLSALSARRAGCCQYSVRAHRTGAG